MSAEKIIQDIANGISALGTERLNKDWVRQILDTNDTVQEEDLTVDADYDIPQDFENICNLVSQKCLLLAKDLAKQSQDEPVEARMNSLNITTPAASSTRACLWSNLAEHQIEIQPLLALLRFTMESDRVPDTKCFSSMNFYLSLLCVPGSSAFRIFQASIYSKITRNLLYTAKLLTAGSRSSKEKGGRKGRETPVDNTEAEDDETTNIVILNSRESAALLKEVLGLVSSFSTLAEHFSMKRIPKLIDLTLETLIKLIPTFNLGILEAVAEACSKFCCEFHGKVSDIDRRICTCLLPALALHPAEKNLRANDVLMAKDWSLNFLTRILNKVGESFYPAIHILLQNICIRFVDRADSRAKTAQVVVDILKQLPEEHRKRSLQWLLVFAFHEKAAYRLFALEYMSLLLQVNEADYRLLAVVFAHCSDPSATLRAKALSLLADCTESNNPSVAAVFTAIFSRPQQGVNSRRQQLDLVEIIQDPELSGNAEELLPTADSILKLLKNRVQDDKVHVRKSALQLLHAILRCSPTYANQELLELLGRHCMDPSMLIRKQMAQTISDLVAQYPELALVRRVWVKFVLPQIFDSETRVQEKTLECMQQLLLNGLRSQDQLSWSLLETIVDEDMINYLGKAVEAWGRQQLLKPQLLSSIRQQIESEQHTSAAWTLLAALSTQMKWKENAFAVEYFERHLRASDCSNLVQVVITVAASLSSMNSAQQENLRKIFAPYLENFCLPVDLIGPVFHLIVNSFQQDSSLEEAAANEAIAGWATRLLLSCEQFVFNDIQQHSGCDDEQLLRRIITLGHAGLFCPCSLTKNHFLVLQHTCFQDSNTPIASSQPLVVGRPFSPRNQAAAIASIGKICLQHEEMAKMMIPALGRLLDTTPHEAVRNNIVCVLCDMVVRYATAVDPVMPQVTACLRDPSPVVRKRTLVLLIHLLQEDYLKLKGTFLFRILQLVADDDPELRHLALFYFTQRLIPRHPKMLVQHFVECIFHFNEFQGHPTYNKFTLTERERNLFSISGPAHFKRRQMLSAFLLEHMSDEGRFTTTFKLANDVLGGAVAGVIPIDTPSGRAVLQDALAVLASEEIKLASLKATAEEDPVDAEEAAEAVKVSAKKAVISQVVKQNMIENVIPVVMELKQKLQLSPLVRNLMEFLRGLMKDYKDEIKEVLAADRQLVAEIEFDLKQYEQQRKNEMQQRPSAVNAPPLLQEEQHEAQPNPAESAPPATVDNEAAEPAANEVEDEEMDEPNESEATPRRSSERVRRSQAEQVETTSSRANQEKGRKLRANQKSTRNSAANGDKVPTVATPMQTKATPLAPKQQTAGRTRTSQRKNRAPSANENETEDVAPPTQDPVTPPRARQQQNGRTRVNQKKSLIPTAKASEAEDLATPIEAELPLPNENGADAEKGDAAAAIEAGDELTDLAPVKRRKTNPRARNTTAKSRTTTRVTRSRVISTPIRGVPNDHVTFLDHDAELSLIPHASILQ